MPAMDQWPYFYDLCYYGSYLEIEEVNNWSANCWQNDHYTTNSMGLT